jgi:hypothetical protein
VAAKTDLPRVVVLIASIVTLVIVVIVRVRPAMISDTMGSEGKGAQVGRYKVPTLGWDKDTARVLPMPRAGRSLFAYGPPPTPTPDPRPTPTPKPTRIPEPVGPEPTPTKAIWWPLPPPPPFKLTYIGWLGPDRLPIAVFRDGDDVLAVPVGGAIKEKFILRVVEPTIVTLGYVGYPESVTSQVAIVR